MRIGIYGLGTLGSHFADICIGMFRDQHEWILIDYDKVEARNVGIQVYEQRDIGRLKVDALGLYLYNRYGICSFDAIKRKIVHSEQLEELNLNLLIEMVDNRDAIERSVGLDCPVLHLKFSIFQNNPTGLVQWDDVFQMPDVELEDDPCDIPSIRPFAVLIAAQGVLALQGFLSDGKGKKESYIVSVNGIRKIA